MQLALKYKTNCQQCADGNTEWRRLLEHDWRPVHCAATVIQITICLCTTRSIKYSELSENRN